MKKLMIIIIVIIIAAFAVGALFLSHNKRNEQVNALQQSGTSNINTSNRTITKEMAYEGVYNYCHSTYDWTIAEDNPSIMYIEMGDETESEYQVTFRSYTGAFVYFYVNKLTGSTRLIEYVPTLNVESEAGTIDLFDYLNNNNKQ